MSTNDWIAVFTGALVIVGALQVYFLWAALNATREALIADKRAFLIADNFAQFWEVDTATSLYNWRLRPRWRNNGDTPTRGLTMHTECEIRNSALPDGYAFAYDKTQIGRGIIPPKADLLGGIAPTGAPITAQDILDAQAGKKFIYLWGCAKYCDVFPGTAEHTTHFCWYITITGNPTTFVPNTPGQPPMPGTLAFNYLQHHEGNYTDET